MIPNQRQSRWDSYRRIMKYHGPYKGLRRVFDQYWQSDRYDDRHETNFSQILSGDQFYASIGAGDQASVMHYQPVYTAAVRRPLEFLAHNYSVLGASSTCFLDLGCGRGKALHVARSVLQHITILGIDLNTHLLEDAAKNLNVNGHAAGAERQNNAKLKLIASNANGVDYETLLSPYDAILVFNKNSFDKKTTENTLDRIRQCTIGKTVFYIYSNPVFEASFGEFPCVYSMSGWHKNWNSKVFAISQ